MSEAPYNYETERADAEAHDKTHWTWIGGTAYDSVWLDPRDWS